MKRKFDPNGRHCHTTICEFHRAKVLQLLESGVSIGEIARQVGTKRVRVREFLKRNNLKAAIQAPLKGDKSPAWRGGRRVNKDGYVEIRMIDHPNARKSGYILEHRWVMEKMIGRYLLPEEVVHHRDSNRENNDPGNLMLFSENSEHLKHELTGRVPKWSPEGFERIGNHNVTPEQIQKLQEGHRRWRDQKRSGNHS